MLGETFLSNGPRPDRNPKKLMEIYNNRINRGEISSPTACALLDRARDFTVILPASLPFGYNHLDYDADNVLVNHDKIAAVLDLTISNTPQ
jgi:hypothetical protein